MTKSYSDDDRQAFYDEQGRLVKNSWEIKAEQEEVARLLKKKHEEKQAARRKWEYEEREKAKRKARADKNEALRQARRQREYFHSLPDYLKNMPHVPLDDPPTRGVIAQWKTKRHKKTVLRDDERKEREENLTAYNKALEVHGNIRHASQDDREKPPVVITVIAPHIYSGVTPLVRMMSTACVENRERRSLPIISMDFGYSENNIASRFGKKSSSFQVGMIDVINTMEGLKHGGVDTVGFNAFAASGGHQNEFLMPNDDYPDNRIAHPTVEQTAELIEIFSEDYGVIINDCDTEQPEAMLGALSISDVVIVVIPTASDMKFDEEKSGLYEFLHDKLGDVLRDIPVVACVMQHSADHEVPEVKDAYDFHSGFFLGYDPHLRSSREVVWSKLHPSTRATVREITGVCMSLARLYDGGDNEAVVEPEWDNSGEDF